MFSSEDDPLLVDIALSKGFILEDEVRECNYSKPQFEGASVISVLKRKGYLSEPHYLELLKVHSDRQLMRDAIGRGKLDCELHSARIARALVEAEATFPERLHGGQRRKPVSSRIAQTVLVCAGCGTKYNASILQPGTQYRCRKCNNALEVPAHGTAEEVEAEVEEALDAEDLVGQMIGGCRIMERIGEGGMGVVYRGKHLTLERDVAVKVLPCRLTTDFFRRRFLVESRAAARLIHPNVVQIFDAGEEKGNPYIVMEYVEGATVKQLINTRKRLGLSFVVRVIGESARGLAAAHKLKLVHRDVKPENIMISFTGDTKVMDFGLAKDVGMQGDVTKAGMLMGTPFYMAPEQFMSDAEVDERADIYALGVTLYHMLAGRPPFVGDSPYKIMNAHLNETYKPVKEFNTSVPEELEKIVDNMLVKDRKKRYQTMLQVVRDIERLRLPSEQAPAQE